ncbi:MAG: hypothetical protein HGGPFJEG_01317 [Ignavibacteria bacterium]|nr:hypothetical protein [Ignavibacteria bacterium]
MKSGVSIITPLYNGINTLYETYESILNQDYDLWEWILFDDGSKDNTQKLAREISGKHPDKIFFYEHEGNKNFGTAFTRNRAVEKSKYEILSFIDQDDVWYNDRLSHQLKIFSLHSDCAMIWGPSLYWYKDREFKQPVGYKAKGLESGMYLPPEFIKIFLSNFWGTPLPSATLIKKKNFNSVNGYEESIKGSEDIVLWLKIADKFPVYYEDKILVKYRKHSASTLRTANESGEMNEWNIVFYRWVLEFLKDSKAGNELTDDIEFKLYNCLKKISSGNNYFISRKILYDKLCEFPEIKDKYRKDFLLDIILPYKLSSKISAKLRFDFFK